MNNPQKTNIDPNTFHMPLNPKGENVTDKTETETKNAVGNILDYEKYIYEHLEAQLPEITGLRENPKIQKFVKDIHETLNYGWLFCLADSKLFRIEESKDGLYKDITIKFDKYNEVNKEFSNEEKTLTIRVVNFTVLEKSVFQKLGINQNDGTNKNLTAYLDMLKGALEKGYDLIHGPKIAKGKNPSDLFLELVFNKPDGTKYQPFLEFSLGDFPNANLAN